MRFAIADFAHKLCSKKQQNNQGVVSSFSAAYNKFSKKYYKIHQMDLFRKKSGKSKQKQLATIGVARRALPTNILNWVVGLWTARAVIGRMVNVARKSKVAALRLDRAIVSLSSAWGRQSQVERH